MSDNRIAEVTQADRDAFIDYEKNTSIGLNPTFCAAIRAGDHDADRRIQAFARHREAHRTAASQASDAGEAVTIPADHPLAKGLRTSQKALDKIAQQEQANIAGYLALRDFPVGSTNAQFPPDEVGPNKMGTDWTDITGQLREISRISKVYDLRAAIDGAGDNWTWRDLMDQCDILATLTAPPTSDAGEAAVEAVAQWLHDEGGFADACPTRTWPEHPDDTGRREGGFVRLVPKDVQAQFRDVARRLLTQSAAAALSPPTSGEEMRLREALPRLDDGLIEAAMLAHYGKWASNLGINGVDLTANDANWTFRDGFKRMWAGVRKELNRRAALKGAE